MTKVYIPDTKSVRAGLPISLIFWPNYRFDIPDKRLFLKEIMESYTEPFFEIVSTAEKADFVAVPFDYFFARQYGQDYLRRAYKVAKEAKKKVLLFDYTDYVDRSPRIPPHGILFRVSAYRHHKRQNEIVMPYFVQDFGACYDIKPKGKGNPLLVGYCGQARFGNAFRKWKANAKRIAQSIALYLKRDGNPKVHARGIFWRNAAIRALRKSGIESRIIERSFYSLHRSGVIIEPKELRSEYVENLRECDLALCTRGDANASQRFYEVLSAFRIPLFLDTDSVLPLEEIISYDDFIVRVPANDIAGISAHIRSWDSAHSTASFLERELRAREVYEKYLRIDRYFEIVFDREQSPYKSILYGD